MKSSNDATPQRNFALLLIGAPKTGKTTFAVTMFPRPYVANCENNLHGALTMVNKLKATGGLPKNYTVLYDDICTDDNGAPVELWNRWGRLEKCLKAAVVDKNIDTIILDGQSAVNQFLIDHILKQQPGKVKIAGEPIMEIQHWQPFQALMMRLIVAMRNSGKLFVVTAHEEAVKDDLSGVLKYKVHMSSRLQHSYGGLFSDVWRVEAEEKNGAFANRVRTLPTARAEGLGTSLGLPAEFNMTWAEFAKYIGGNAS